MSVQTLLPELAVERLYEGIIGWFSWTREVQCDVIDIGPKVKVAAFIFLFLIGYAAINQIGIGLCECFFSGFMIDSLWS